MRAIIKDFLGRMDGVGYDDEFGDIIGSTCLVDTASNSKGSASVLVTKEAW